MATNDHRPDPGPISSTITAASLGISPPVFIDAATMRSILTYQTLIRHLQTYLPAASTVQSPLRQIHQTNHPGSLLLMPSWSVSPALPYMGVKLVTHYPNNSLLNLPIIHAAYALFNSLTGQNLATIDGTELTLQRTACVSAVASLYLSRENSQTLVMVGAGSLGPHLIKAHLAARPSINKVIIWNRTAGKARSLAEKMNSTSQGENEIKGRVCFESTEDLDEAVGKADVVSCATNSEIPLVKGEKLKVGAHLDLVGSFRLSMRECDDRAIARGRVFVDSEAAFEEAGELVGVERGVTGSLVELITGEREGRRDEKEITVFKSVGSAVVDLLSAQLVYETFVNRIGSV
ncbi:Thiomorpholine-carboxylate dehydrogenase [Bertholletia excelsa]